MRPQLKILFEIEALPILEKKNWKNLLEEEGGGGGGGWHPPPLAIGGLKTICIKQIVSKAETSLLTHELWYNLYQILNTVFPYSNQAKLSASPGCSGKLRPKVV